MSLVRLDCPAQKYAWGKIGLASKVAQLVDAQGRTVDGESPYAELWMGTHPNGPSKVMLDNGEELLLSEYLKNHPEAVSEDEDQQAQCAELGLPYLFKILSVNTALSIQAHPDKKLAEQLHGSRPDVYKDPNHKPEMACAITPFEALAGFMPVSEALKHIRATPELQELLEENQEVKALLGDETKLLAADEPAQKETLKVLFSTLMTSSPESVEKQVAALAERLEKVSNIEMPDALALRLADQYPGDVGVFCAYFMCYRKLEPGQSVFLGANEPHAYLAGDCAEIMACSDNVVRAGLTPKLRDTDTLVSMLTYRQPSHVGSEFHPNNLLEGDERDDHSKVYAPPDPAVDEFQMERVALKAEDGPYDLLPSTYASIFVVLEGDASAASGADGAEQDISRGDVFLQPAGSKVVLSPKDDGLLLFRASLKGAF